MIDHTPRQYDVDDPAHRITFGVGDTDIVALPIVRNVKYMWCYKSTIAWGTTNSHRSRNALVIRHKRAPSSFSRVHVYMMGLLIVWGVVSLGFGLMQQRVLAVMSEGKLGYSARGAHEYGTRTF